MKQKYIKPDFKVMEIQEPICGHYDSTGRWHLFGNQFINEYYGESQLTFPEQHDLFIDSLSNSSDFLKFNSKVWQDQW